MTDKVWLNVFIKSRRFQLCGGLADVDRFGKLEHAQRHMPVDGVLQVHADVSFLIS